MLLCIHAIYVSVYCSSLSVTSYLVYVAPHRTHQNWIYVILDTLLGKTLNAVSNWSVWGRREEHYEIKDTKGMLNLQPIHVLIHPHT